MNSNWELFGVLLLEEDSTERKAQQMSSVIEPDESIGPAFSISSTPIPEPRRDYRGKWGMPLTIYPFQPYPIGWLVPHILFAYDTATEGTEYDYTFDAA